MRAVLFLALLLMASACAGSELPPGREGVEEVELLDAESEAIDSEDLLEGLATAEPSGFLGLFLSYEPFDEDVLARDLERVERFYRARGYYEAKVVAARVIPSDSERPRVIVQIKIQQGTPVLTRSVRVSGIELLPFRVATQALTSVRLRDGEPFDEESFEATKQALADVLADEGYAFVEVKGTAQRRYLPPCSRRRVPSEARQARPVRRGDDLRPRGDPRRSGARQSFDQKGRSVFEERSGRRARRAGEPGRVFDRRSA